MYCFFIFFFSSRRRHTRWTGDWSSDVCSSDLGVDEQSPPQFEDAITLDDPAALARIDTSDMLGRVRELPRQLALARRIAAATLLEPRYRDVDRVLLLAMGGSAIGGDLVAGIAGPRLRVPLIVHRDYELPG